MISYETASRLTMSFDEVSRMMSDPDRERREYWTAHRAASA
jgi:hypothetical protein